MQALFIALAHFFFMAILAKNSLTPHGGLETMNIGGYPSKQEVN